MNRIFLVMEDEHVLGAHSTREGACRKVGMLQWDSPSGNYWVDGIKVEQDDPDGPK